MTGIRTLRHYALAGALLMAIAMSGCGPGEPGGDAPTLPEPEWTYGWWMSAGGLQDHFEWGAYIPQMEIRPDGTVLQMLDYCDGEDWEYEGRWELQPNGAVRILPAEGDDTVPFQYPTEVFQHVDLRPGDDSCGLFAVRVSSLDGDESAPIPFERGHWCMGQYLPEFDECEMEKDCGNEPPICE